MIHKLTANLNENSRACSHCKKGLAGTYGMLYIVAPGMGKTWEFCSWYCLVRYTTKMLQTKILDSTLCKTDILSQLGVSRKWGAVIPKEDLESPIEDPLEDKDANYEQQKKDNTRPADGD